MENPELTATLTRLADIFYGVPGKIRRSPNPLYQRALAIWGKQRTAGKFWKRSQPWIVWRKFTVLQGAYEKAEPFLTTVLAIKENTLGQGKP